MVAKKRPAPRGGSVSSGSSRSSGGGRRSTNKAQAWERARRKDCGTAAAPAAGPAIVDFVKLMMEPVPFPEITDEGRRAEIIERLKAITQNVNMVRWLKAIIADPTAGLAANAGEHLRFEFFDLLVEIRGLLAMVEAAKALRPAPNPDGLYAANTATAATMNMDAGGLKSYMEHGQPTAVTIAVHGRRAVRAGTPALRLPQRDAQRDAQRDVQNNNNNPQVRGGGAPCGYCGKIGHVAQVCRARIADERRAPPPPRPAAPAPGPPVDGDALRAAFEKWLKEQK